MMVQLPFQPLRLLLMIQVKPAATEGDMYRYVIQSLTAFGQVVFKRACEKSATRGHSSNVGPGEEARGGVTTHGNAPQAEEVSDAMAAALKDGLIEFGHLQEAVDR